MADHMPPATRPAMTPPLTRDSQAGTMPASAASQTKNAHHKGVQMPTSVKPGFAPSGS